MTQHSPKDIVVDTTVMRLYDKPRDTEIADLFKWIKKTGILTVNKKLISEYAGIGKNLVLILLNELHRDGRLNRIPDQQLRSFTKDRHFRYQCNCKDIIHARTVFLSYRKRCISFDKNLRRDINNFRKIDGIKPCACRHPKDCCLN